MTLLYQIPRTLLRALLHGVVYRNVHVHHVRNLALRYAGNFIYQQLVHPALADVNTNPSFDEWSFVRTALNTVALVFQLAAAHTSDPVHVCKYWACRNTIISICKVVQTVCTGRNTSVLSGAEQPTLALRDTLSIFQQLQGRRALGYAGVNLLQMRARAGRTCLITIPVAVYLSISARRNASSLVNAYQRCGSGAGRNASLTLLIETRT